MSSLIVSIRKRDKNKEKDTQKLQETHKDQKTWAQLFLVQGVADFLVAPSQGKD